MTIVEIEVAIKVLDYHIERLEAKLLFLIRSCDDSCTDLSLYQYEKKIATVKQEIAGLMEERQRLKSEANGWCCYSSSLKPDNFRILLFG